MSTFFQQIESITDDIQVDITIKSKGGIMSVLVMPKASSNKIKQLTLSGTPSELDEGFMEAISKSSLPSTGLIVSEASASNTIKASKIKGNDIPKKQSAPSLFDVKKEETENIDIDPEEDNPDEDDINETN